jgi:uncharacterized protein (DUF2062 family)
MRINLNAKALSSFNLKRIWKEKIYDPVVQLAKQGTSPKKLAWATALGAVMGIMPAIGPVTALTAFLALRLRLNVALAIGVSYLMTPLYLLLYVPFIHLGLWFFEADFIMTYSDIRDLFEEDWFFALKEIGFGNLMGLAAWLVVSVPVLGLLYIALLPLYKMLLKKYQNGEGEKESREMNSGRPEKAKIEREK